MRTLKRRTARDFSKHIKILNEGFELNGKVICFDPKSKKIRKPSKVARRHTPYEMKMPFGTILSPYIDSDNIPDGITHDEFLLALNSNSDKFTIDKKSYDKFIKQVSSHISKIIKQEGVHTIMLMNVSNKLLLSVTEQLAKRHNNMFYYDRILFKNPNISTSDLDTKGLSEKVTKGLYKNINKQKKNKFFSIKKFQIKNRGIIIDWLNSKNEFLSNIAGKNVILIDDILTTGESFKESSVFVSNAGANKIIGIAVIK